MTITYIENNLDSIIEDTIKFIKESCSDAVANIIAFKDKLIIEICNDETEEIAVVTFTGELKIPDVTVLFRRLTGTTGFDRYDLANGASYKEVIKMFITGNENLINEYYECGHYYNTRYLVKD